MRESFQEKTIQKNNQFTEGKILPALIRFSVPLVLSLLLQALYGAVDLMVVGRFDTTAGFSAVATGSQLMQTVTGLILGLTAGVTVLIGQAVGAGDLRRAGDIAAGIVKLMMIVSAVLSAVLVVFAPAVVKVLNVPEAAAADAVLYIRICGAGTVFISMYNAISGIFRGVGNSKMPLIFILIACITNIFADLLLVAVFHLGAAGAAIATVFAQAVSVIFSVMYIKRVGLPFPFGRDNFKKERTKREILKIGTPIALQDFLVRISFLIITAIMNSLGLVASASIGIDEKLFVFLSLVPTAFLSALAAFVAQNIGAHKPERAVAVLKIATVISLTWGVGVFLATFFGGEILAGIFEKNPEVTAATASYLKSCSFEHLFISVSFCMLGFFNGLGKTGFVMAQGLISSFFVRIPLSYILSKTTDGNLFMIGLAVPISAAVALAMCYVYYFILHRRIKLEKLPVS